MKKCMMLMCVLLLALSAQAKDKVYDRPAFRSSSESMYPVKVVLTKKATVVHFRAQCAHWRQWSMVGARLECGGKTYAYQHGRIITHDGGTVLADDAFEIGRRYEQNAQQDSLVLTFEPLPKDAVTFDYIEEGDNAGWRTCGIRLDNQLYPSIFPPYQSRVDDGEPLKPLTLQYGKATGTLVSHGGTTISYFGDFSRDPITNLFDSDSRYDCEVTFYSHPAYVATRPLFVGSKVDSSMVVAQFPLILIPGETFTLDVDAAACSARDYDFMAGKPANRDCYRVGGTLGDLNQVLLENDAALNFRFMKEIPDYSGQTFTEWRDELWQSLDTLRRGAVERHGYTRRQQDFLRLLVEDNYVRLQQDYRDVIVWKMKLQNPDSALAKLAETYTLADPHAQDLLLFRDGRTYYLPPKPERLPYLEANGLNHGEVYEFLKGFAEAQAVGEKIKFGKVQPDSVILAAYPYFQPVLRAFNDSTRVLMDRLRQEAKDRMMPIPDVPADQLFQSIVAQHPGKAVFFDLWATWCGPCLNGIRQMESLKKKLQGRDVVFVYLTDESSPINQWNEYVLEVPGLHYRLPASLWEQLPCFSTDGSIPQYFLYDCQGQQVWHQVGFSTSVLEDMEREINQVLE